MNMPSFNAQASLYTSAHVYHAFSTMTNSGPGAVTPATVVSVWTTCTSCENGYRTCVTSGPTPADYKTFRLSCAVCYTACHGNAACIAECERGTIRY